jgi:hypothetical protein
MKHQSQALSNVSSNSELNKLLDLNSKLIESLTAAHSKQADTHSMLHQENQKLIRASQERNQEELETLPPQFLALKKCMKDLLHCHEPATSGRLRIVIERVYDSLIQLSKILENHVIQAKEGTRSNFNLENLIETYASLQGFKQASIVGKHFHDSMAELKNQMNDENVWINNAKKRKDAGSTASSRQIKIQRTSQVYQPLLEAKTVAELNVLITRNKKLNSLREGEEMIDVFVQGKHLSHIFLTRRLEKKWDLLPTEQTFQINLSEYLRRNVRGNIDKKKKITFVGIPHGETSLPLVLIATICKKNLKRSVNIVGSTSTSSSSSSSSSSAASAPSVTTSSTSPPHSSRSSSVEKREYFFDKEEKSSNIVRFRGREAALSHWHSYLAYLPDDGGVQSKPTIKTDRQTLVDTVQKTVKAVIIDQARRP